MADPEFREASFTKRPSQRPSRDDRDSEAVRMALDAVEQLVAVECEERPALRMASFTNRPRWDDGDYAAVDPEARPQVVVVEPEERPALRMASFTNRPIRRPSRRDDRPSRDRRSPQSRTSTTHGRPDRNGLDVRQASFAVTSIVNGEDFVLYPVKSSQKRAPWVCDTCGAAAERGMRFAAHSEDVDACEDCVTSDTRTCGSILAVVNQQIAQLERIRSKLLATQAYDVGGAAAADFAADSAALRK